MGTSYTKLKKDNIILKEQNKKLRKILFTCKKVIDKDLEKIFTGKFDV